MPCTMAFRIHGCTMRPNSQSAMSWTNRRCLTRPTMPLGEFASAQFAHSHDRPLSLFHSVLVPATRASVCQALCHGQATKTLTCSGRPQGEFAHLLTVDFLPYSTSRKCNVCVHRGLDCYTALCIHDSAFIWSPREGS